MLFTVSLIFQKFPRVATGVCLFVFYRLNFKLVYGPLHGELPRRLCAETLSPRSLYFEPKPNLSKTLEGLLMRLVITVNTNF